MADYDDSDESSIANSFRARSNTWPLNRHEAIPNLVNVDETLPEIQLEDDDLFTINENWSNAADFVDHDIMSWDPILNAQSVSASMHATQGPHLQTNTNSSTTTTPSTATTPNTTTTQNQQAQHNFHNSSQLHQRNQQQNIQLHSQHQNDNTQRQQHDIGHDTIPSSSSIRLLPNNQIPQHQQTLNSNCFQNSDLNLDDQTDYQIGQLQQLRLTNQTSTTNPHPYISPPSSICLQQTVTCSENLLDGYNSLSDDHHQLTQLTQTSATYYLDVDSNEHVLSANLTSTDQQLQPLLDQKQRLYSSQLLSSLNSNDAGLGTELDSGLGGYIPVDPSGIQPQSSDLNNSLQQKQSISGSKSKLNTPRRNAWGNFSYADLISQAIDSTTDKRLTLSQIYDWMVQHVPYFKDKGDSNSSAGWKNSVRHNLSLHNRFKRIQNEGTGKSSWWTINPEANIGKCARRRAASMEASKYEKKRRGAKKRADAIRSGLVPGFPSLTNASLPNTFNLEQSSNQITRTSSCGKNSNLRKVKEELVKSESLTNSTCLSTQTPHVPQPNQQEQTTIPHVQPQQQQISYEVQQLCNCELWQEKCY